MRRMSSKHKSREKWNFNSGLFVWLYKCRFQKEGGMDGCLPCGGSSHCTVFVFCGPMREHSSVYPGKIPKTNKSPSDLRVRLLREPDGKAWAPGAGTVSLLSRPENKENYSIPEVKCKCTDPLRTMRVRN